MTTYADVKAWREKNKDKVAAQGRRYREKHPATHQKAAKKYRENNIEKVRERDKEAQRKFRKNNPEEQKIRNERHAIKKEVEKWKIAGRPRSLICEICDKEERTVFDHCHISGKFRGWICDRCNKTLGIVKDSSELLIKMARYLETHNVKDNNESA